MKSIVLNFLYTISFQIYACLLCNVSLTDSRFFCNYFYTIISVATRHYNAVT